MTNAISEYAKLVSNFDTVEGIEVGQMFGKACVKVHGKAFLSQQKDLVIFKLTGVSHQIALALEGASLWDPSGKGRPMKEWVALPATERIHFASFAAAAHAYVAAAARSA